MMAAVLVNLSWAQAAKAAEQRRYFNGIKDLQGSELPSERRQMASFLKRTRRSFLERVLCRPRRIHWWCWQWRFQNVNCLDPSLTWNEKTCSNKGLLLSQRKKQFKKNSLYLLHMCLDNQSIFLKKDLSELEYIYSSTFLRWNCSESLIQNWIENFF